MMHVVGTSFVNTIRPFVLGTVEAHQCGKGRDAADIDEHDDRQVAQNASITADLVFAV